MPGRAALDWWARRLDEHGVARRPIVERDGRALHAFTDPEGQPLELVDDTPSGTGPGVAPGVPWSRGSVLVEHGSRGLEGVTLFVRNLEPTATVLTRVLGFRPVAESRHDGHHAVRYEVGPGGPGAEVRVV